LGCRSILEHKATLNKYKKIAIISFILKLEIKSKLNCRKYSNTWRLLNEQQGIKEIRGNKNIPIIK
jgi:hypothetical protein